MVELPILLDPSRNLFGILRYPKIAKKVVVFVPAFEGGFIKGSRTGPNRVFVEISRKLVGAGVATLCIDIPSEVEATSNDEPNFENAVHGYLRAIECMLRTTYNFDEFIWSGFSLGCVMVLNYVSTFGQTTVMLLSPNHVEDACNSLIMTPYKREVRALCIFGESDVFFKPGETFWNDYFAKVECSGFSVKVVNNSDHCFSGWSFKEQVSKVILEWVK